MQKSRDFKAYFPGYSKMTKLYQNDNESFQDFSSFIRKRYQFLAKTRVKSVETPEINF